MTGVPETSFSTFIEKPCDLLSHIFLALMVNNLCSSKISQNSGVIRWKRIKGNVLFERKNIKDCKQRKKEHVLLLCLMCEVSDKTYTNSARNIHAIQITKGG